MAIETAAVLLSIRCHLIIFACCSGVLIGLEKSFIQRKVFKKPEQNPASFQLGTITPSDILQQDPAHVQPFPTHPIHTIIQKLNQGQRRMTTAGRWHRVLQEWTLKESEENKTTCYQTWILRTKAWGFFTGKPELGAHHHFEWARTRAPLLRVSGVCHPTSPCLKLCGVSTTKRGQGSKRNKCNWYRHTLIFVLVQTSCVS